MAKTKTLLDSIPKRGRDAIRIVMAERGGDLPLEQFLARNWAEPLKHAGTERMTAAIEPHLRSGRFASPELAMKTLMLLGLNYGLKEHAIARRFTLDDPSELGRGLAVVNRLRQIGARASVDSIRNGLEFDVLLQECALGEFDRARESVARMRPGYRAIPDDNDLSWTGVASILQGNTQRLETATKAMADRKVAPWQRSVYTALTGIANREPAAFQAGLSSYVSDVRLLKRKDELEEAVMLCAHGLFRLAEHIAPALTAGFDVALPIPWDAGFHAWSNANPDPLAGVDLSSVSPEVHEAIVLGPPSWLPPSRATFWEVIVQSTDPKNAKAFELLAQYASGNPKQVKTLLADGPFALCWNLQEEHHARMVLTQLENVGVVAEARVMPECM